MVADPVPARAIYTTLFGGYERLNESHAQQPGFDLICFTDDSTLTSTLWEVVVVSPAFPLDLVRSQRLVKILGHDRLSGYGETLYVDNSVTFKVPMWDLVTEWLADADVAMPLHSYRSSVADEFAAVTRHALDELPRIVEQFDHYTLEERPIARLRPYWTAIIARRRSSVVERASQLWAHHVMRFSRRDQLSCRVAFGEDGPPVHEIDIDNFESHFHSWPSDVGRSIYARASLAAMRVPVDLRLRQAEQALLKVTEERDTLMQRVASLEAQTLWLQGQVVALDGRRQTLWSAVKSRIPRAVRARLTRS